MTYQALTTAITGLRAAQQQLSVISNNVSNATTPGYNRQVLPQTTQILRETGQTVGVLTKNVIRVVDMSLQRDLWTQVSATGLQDVQLQYLQQIQTFNGPPEKEFSIAAKIAELRDSFSALSDIPDDTAAQQTALNQAHNVANKFNEYADMLTRLRTDTQGDLQSSVNRVNDLLQEITNINRQVRGAENVRNSVASLQDQRDIAIKSLTEEMSITFFERSDGVMVVQTADGRELAGDDAQQLSFQGVPIGALQYYPQSVSSLNLVSKTNNQTTIADITDTKIGGRIGGLIQMRDTILPSYTAQIDELAYQMASRFDAQGLRLFTDQNGNVPANTAPDPSTLPLPTSVPYVDFARVMRVNSQIDDDLTLLQRGTYPSDTALPSGDNSLIRRVLEHTFGNISYQEIVGTTDLSTTGEGLQGRLGIHSQNRVVSTVDLTSIATTIDDGDPLNMTDLVQQYADYFPNFPNEDQFEITFEETRLGLGPDIITIDLSVASTSSPGASVAQQIADRINNRIAALVDPALNASASVNQYGELIIASSGNITIDGSSTAAMLGSETMALLGIPEGVFVTEDPYFTVQVGNGEPKKITIEPGDIHLDLIAKLEWDPLAGTGVPGLYAELNAGEITLRPGIDDSNGGPYYGGDITIVGGPYETDGSGTAPNLTGLTDPMNIVSALFGSFTVSGATVIENSPITNVSYQSEVNGADLVPSYTNFRNEFLGPNAAVSTGIFSADNLLDYAQKVIDKTSQDFLQAQSAYENEDTLRGIIQRQFSDKSGVNIDEEMSNLIVVQTAYAAAARTVTAADEMFQELIDSFRR